MAPQPRGITIEFSGERVILLKELVLDFNGTLACDGNLLPGVAERLSEIARHVRITVLTADTFGKVKESLRELPAEVRIISTGAEKERFVRKLGQDQIVAIGNGRNDTGMVQAAAFGIAVVGPEGCAGELLRAADVITGDILVALDLLMHPLRLKATLRD